MPGIVLSLALLAPAVFSEPAAASAGCPVLEYGVGKLNSLGCVPEIEAVGAPSATDPTPFTISAANITPFCRGALFYSFAQDEAPFFGGTRYIALPMTRTELDLSFGTVGVCDGAYSIDFNAYMQSGKDPSLTVGRRVFGQFFYYDLGDPVLIGMTDAVAFVICP